MILTCIKYPHGGNGFKQFKNKNAFVLSPSSIYHSVLRGKTDVFIELNGLLHTARYLDFNYSQF